jgi:hypothetical protein
MTSTSGPDIPAIQCRVPDGCCGGSPCDVDEELFICWVRAFAPEGQVYNNTKEAAPPADSGQQSLGATAIGCNRVGCEQLIVGGCCGDIIHCDDDPPLPQLALLDSFASVGFGSVEALCVLLRELDPCRAQLTVKLWAERLGITFPDRCAGEWSDKVLSLLICLIWSLKFKVMNWDTLTQLAALFGARMLMRYAGQFDCPEQHPTGWWTMARDQQPCPDKLNCADDPIPGKGELIPFVPTCYHPVLSLNIVMWPGERLIPPNCLLPTVPSPQPHDPEFYEAWQWLLPQILPRNAFWCIYSRDEANCIM